MVYYKEDIKTSGIDHFNYLMKTKPKPTRSNYLFHKIRLHFYTIKRTHAKNFFSDYIENQKLWNRKTTFRLKL